MIDRHAEHFREWLVTFPEELLVILRVYADESFTDKAYVLCGFIAPSEYWKTFCRRWKSVLNGFGAPYFHFREFVDKGNNWNIRNNPFLSAGWNESKRDLFINELAIVLSEKAVPIGGAFDNTKFLKLGRPDEINPIETLISQFYIHFQEQLDAHWPGFAGQVLFVFDETGNEDWVGSLNNIHKKVQDADKRIGALSFENDLRCPPLQGVDFWAYATRQIGERYYAQDKTRQLKRTLDWICSKNAYPNFKRIHSKDSWERLVRMVLAHRKKMKAIWSKNGEPKRQYYPEQDFREEAEKLGLPFIEDAGAL